MPRKRKRDAAETIRAGLALVAAMTMFELANEHLLRTWLALGEGDAAKRREWRRTVKQLERRVNNAIDDLRSFSSEWRGAGEPMIAAEQLRLAGLIEEMARAMAEDRAGLK